MDEKPAGKALNNKLYRRKHRYSTYRPWAQGNRHEPDLRGKGTSAELQLCRGKAATSQRVSGIKVGREVSEKPKRGDRGSGKPRVVLLRLVKQKSQKTGRERGREGGRQREGETEKFRNRRTR